jgi:hypothetical protein
MVFPNLPNHINTTRARARTTTTQTKHSPWELILVTIKCCERKQVVNPTIKKEEKI